MNKLYSIVIHGYTYYLSGKIEDEQLEMVDILSRSVYLKCSCDSEGWSLQRFFREFTKTVKKELGIYLRKIDVAYVFRPGQNLGDY